MFKKLQDLHGGEISQVELVEFESKKYVLRTSNISDILNERFFQAELAKNNLAHLTIFNNEALQENQLLLEYIDGSPTLEKHILCDNNSACNTDYIIEWGRQMKKVHEITYRNVFIIDEHGQHDLTWEEAIDREISYGLARQEEKDSGVASETLIKIGQKIENLKNYKPKIFSLLHCDPHENNVLLRGKDLIFFDKQSDFVSGDPLFDLAVIAQAFIGGVAGFEDLGQSCDAKNLEYFIEGYGDDFRTHQYFNEFLLMRSLTRHPNPVRKNLGEIMKRLI